VQDDIHAARGISHGFRIARIDFDNLRARRRVFGRRPAHEARDLPPGIAKRLGGATSDAPGGTQYEYASAHLELTCDQPLSITSKRQWPGIGSRC
jgi:hypothetical protein